MKIFLTTLFALLLVSNIYSQPLPGGAVYPINNIESPPTQFAKISSAVAYLSSHGVGGSGNIIFELGTSYNPLSEPLTGIDIPNISGTNSSRIIIFRPAASVSKTIQVSQNGGSAINFNGCSYVTIDGKQGGSGAVGLTLINLSFDHTVNTAVVKFSGDATYNTLTSCIVNGAALSDTSGNVYFTFSGSSTGNSFNTVSFCDIGGLGTKLPVNGILSIGKSTEVNNTDNVITDNTIHDFTVDIGKTHGVDVRAFCKNFIIQNNSFYQTAPRVFSGNSKMDCINIDEPNLGVGFKINKNIIGGSNSSGSGTMDLYSDFALDFNGIKLNVSSSSVSEVNENKIRNVTLSNHAIFLSETSGINIIEGKVDIGVTTGNVIGSTSGTGSFNISSPSTSDIYNVFGIVSSSSSQVRINNNKVGGITLNGLLGFIDICGIFSVNSSSVTIDNNEVGNATPSNIQGGNNLDNNLFGIYCNFNANATITNNKIRNFEFKNTINDQSHSIVGITDQVWSLTGVYTVSNNEVYNMTISSPVHNFLMAGIREKALGTSSQNYTSDIQNNLIHDFNTTSYSGVAGVNQAEVRGISSEQNSPGQKKNGTIDQNTIYNLNNNYNIDYSETNGIFNDLNSNSLHFRYNVIYNINSTCRNTSNIYRIAESGITNAGSGIFPNMDISENTIANLTLMGSDTCKTAGIVNTGNSKISRNKIYNVGNQINNFAAISAGILTYGLGMKTQISNNMITIGLNSINNNAVYGILSNMQQDSLLIFYNSIVVTGSGAGADNSAGIYRRGFYNATNMITKNNIVMNNRTPGTANSLVFTDDYVGSSHNGWTEGSSNYNTLIGNSPSMFAYYYSDFRTLADYKTQSTSDFYSYFGQATSGTSDAHFVNPDNLFTNYLIGDLSIKTGNPECWYSFGKSITGTDSRFLSEDFSSGSIRGTALGYPACTGAYEFTTSALPFSCIASASVSDGAIVHYDFGYRNLFDFTFHASAGAVPSSVIIKYFSGKNPPSSFARRTDSYWSFNAIGGSGYNYDMVWFTTPAEQGNIPDYLNARGANYNGSQWNFVVGNFIIISPYYNMFTFDARTITLDASAIFCLTDAVDPLPVELSSFTSSVNSNKVKLNWSTVSETNNKEFVVERKSASQIWNKIGSVNGNGTSTIAHNYIYTDNGLTAGKYNYRLKQIDYNGNFKYFDLTNEVTIGNPVNYSLSQNYPNPFNPVTKINYEIKSAGLVSLKVYDISGREAAVLVNEIKDAGFYTVTFDAGSLNLSTGSYFYRIETNGFTETKKMMLIK